MGKGPLLRRGRTQQVAQADAEHVLHDDEGAAVGVTEFVNLHDVRVRQPRHPPRLLQEHLAEGGLRGEVGQGALDDDEPLEAVRAVLEREEDFGHASDVEPVHELVAAQVTALKVGRGVGHSVGAAYSRSVFER